MILFAFDCLWGTSKETFTHAIRQETPSEMNGFFYTNKFLLFMAGS